MNRPEPRAGGAGPPLAPSCANGFADGGETDIDCGGPWCVPCGVGQQCEFHSDCLPNLLCVASDSSFDSTIGKRRRLQCRSEAEDDETSKSQVRHSAIFLAFVLAASILILTVCLLCACVHGGAFTVARTGGDVHPRPCARATPREAAIKPKVRPKRVVQDNCQPDEENQWTCLRCGTRNSQLVTICHACHDVSNAIHRHGKEVKEEEEHQLHDNVEGGNDQEDREDQEDQEGDDAFDGDVEVRVVESSSARGKVVTSISFR